MTLRAPTLSLIPRRPVSSAASEEGAVIDADFIALDPLHRYSAPALPGPAKPPPGLGALQHKPSPARFLARPGGWGFWLGGLSLAASAFWVSGGHALFVSQGAPPARAPSLTLSLLASDTEEVSGRAVLHVEAEARNASARTRALPPLSILVTTGKGAAMRYNVQPPPDGIGPNGRQRFSTRLPVPADGVSAVQVAFAQ